MIPWLLVLAVISERGAPLSALVGERMAALPGERGDQPPPLHGCEVDPRARAGALESQARAIDLTDGLSMEFDAWRFNLRGSNTEPLVRLNVETRANPALLRDKTAEVLKLLDG